MNRYAVWFILLAMILTGCGLVDQSPAVLPTVMLDSDGTVPSNPPAGQGGSSGEVGAGEVVASGVVSPARQVQVSSAQGGNVETVLVSAGDSVTAGQVLVQLAGKERLTAAVVAAQTELLAAQQNVSALEQNAGQVRAAAQLRLANANKALDEAVKARNSRKYRNGSDAMIASARADIILANDALDRARDAYNAVSHLDDGNVTKAGALSALSAAEKARDRAVANLNYLLAMPNPVDVDLAEAQLQAAQSEVDDAQAELNKLQNGPDPDALAMAEQRVKNAEAQLVASQAALQSVELTAPFDGVIAVLSTDPGAWVTPGQPLLLLADLQHLQVRTTDLSERDIPLVKIGQEARVYIKALNTELQGQVSEIAPLADTLGGDVVYATTIDLIGPVPEGLRAGMSADVTLLPAP